MKFFISKQFLLLLLAMGLGGVAVYRITDAGGSGADSDGCCGTNMSGMDHSGQQMGNAESVAAQAGTVDLKGQPKTTEQTSCPVMGGEIDKKISTTYKGKTVYFCCPGCIDKFNKNPEAYVGKLPQFAE